METLWRFILIMAFGPALVLVGLQIMLQLIVAVLPVLIVLMLVAGGAAGLVAALVLRGRVPPRSGGPVLPPGTPPLYHYRTRRPRGGAFWRR